jgi:Flp pilus assembly protein TadG
MTQKTRYVFELANDEKGTVLPLFGLMSMIAIAAVGGAIDYGRAYQLRSKLQNSLDASIVSGMSVYQKTTDWTKAMEHANANFDALFATAVRQNAGGSATAGLDIPVVSITNNGTKMTGTASLQANTPFWKLVMGQNLDVGATSAADLSGAPGSTQTLNPVEVSMMVDLTGSMRSNNKIGAFKDAGLSLLDILLPSSGANDAFVRVGVAPFADFVNAGSYAAAVTGLAATSTVASATAYTNATDLAKTGHGAFSGSYSGVISQSNGSQSGATPATGANSGSGVVTTSTGGGSGTAITSGGGTYSSGYCSTQQYTQPAVPASTYALVTNQGKPVAVRLGSNNNGNNNSVSNSATTLPSGVMQASGNAKAKLINKVKWEDNGARMELGDAENGYYIPMLAIPSQGGGIVQKSGADVGIAIPQTENMNGHSAPGLIYGTYWNVTGVNSSGAYTFGGSTTTGFYLPVYTDYGVTAATPATTRFYAGCENTNTASAAPAAAPSSLSLISCVTERNLNGTLAFNDSQPNSSNGWAGSYANKSTSVSNYSTNGKCNVAGRELAPVIPLTNNKTDLANFFNGPSGAGPLIGGGTPGHLGTAWAWYLLSPAWNSIWNLAAPLADYNLPGAAPLNKTKKYAILMTDGEYNEQYFMTEGAGVTAMGGLTAGSSGEQAMQQCTAMKAKGITVITIGFGYSVASSKYIKATKTDDQGKLVENDDKRGTTMTIPTSSSAVTSETNAAYILSKCASPAEAGKHANYYFPYSQADLADTFASIGLTTSPTPVVQQAGRLLN